MSERRNAFWDCALTEWYQEEAVEQSPTLELGLVFGRSHPGGISATEVS